MSMQIVLASAGLMAAILCAGLMGFAIQRGATCTVAAVDEIVGRRRFARLGAIGEAALWVATGLLLANAVGMLGAVPSGYAVTRHTFLGAALLGVGAYVNRACVFGAVARLGSGEWAYVLTPVGFYLGCLSLPYLVAMPATHRLSQGSPVLEASAGVAALAGAAMLLRLLFTLRAAWHADADRSTPPRMLAERVWSPHIATTVIGMSFVALLLLVGAWAYTDVLAELARGMSDNLVVRGALLLALFAGAIFGGPGQRRGTGTSISMPQVLRCLSGGALMGWGSMLIPGSNDGLILVGIPLLWPYAWLAFTVMCATIAGAQWLERTFVALRSARRMPFSPR